MGAVEVVFSALMLLVGQKEGRLVHVCNGKGTLLKRNNSTY